MIAVGLVLTKLLVGPFHIELGGTAIDKDSFKVMQELEIQKIMDIGDDGRRVLVGADVVSTALSMMGSKIYIEVE